MYLRDGKRMQEPEEGAAFFAPIVAPSGMGTVPPRTMGIDMDLLTRGFPGTHGMGADDAAPPPSAPGYMDKVAALNPWVVAGVAAALGFGGTYLWRKR